MFDVFKLFVCHKLEVSRPPPHPPSTAGIPIAATFATKIVDMGLKSVLQQKKH